ncbi:hypothetical protein GCM10022419_024260 [Nonomuraea rosea]|uniref:Secreted protein n=1 Tax=Nonomuraea rosea TaxID=638574 RepID=A0ABP6W1J0_9ACTN
MTWFIVWLITCVTAVALIIAVRQVGKKRVAAARNGGRETDENASASLWTWVERGGWCAGIVSGVAAVWTLFSAPPAAPAKPQSSDSSSVVASSDGYRLEPCSSLDCNDRDKVDLDTGHPGHGSASIQIGPARKGGSAEIILEEDEIHGSDTTPRYVIAPAMTAGAADCVNLLAHQSYRRLDIGLDDLGQGTKLCVETDEKHVALVSVMRISYDPVELEIAFTTWKTDSAW